MYKYQEQLFWCILQKSFFAMSPHLDEALTAELLQHPTSSFTFDAGHSRSLLIELIGEDRTMHISMEELIQRARDSQIVSKFFSFETISVGDSFNAQVTIDQNQMQSLFTESKTSREQQIVINFFVDELRQNTLEHIFDKEERSSDWEAYNCNHLQDIHDICTLVLKPDVLKVASKHEKLKSVLARIKKTLEKMSDNQKSLALTDAMNQLVSDDLEICKSMNL